MVLISPLIQLVSQDKSCLSCVMAEAPFDRATSLHFFVIG